MSPYGVDTLATTELRFQARQAIVRRLIGAGDLDPYDGLALVVWPTAALLDAETGLTASICYQRARQDAA